jgi:hypothetical protein
MKIQKQSVARVVIHWWISCYDAPESTLVAETLHRVPRGTGAMKN